MTLSGQTLAQSRTLLERKFSFDQNTRYNGDIVIEVTSFLVAKLFSQTMAQAKPHQPELPKDLKLVADFLISSASELNLRNGTIQGQRAQYFKGKHAENALMRDAFKQKHGKTLSLESREECGKYLQELLNLGLILKASKEEGTKKLIISPDRIYISENIYVWVYQGSQLMGRLMGIGVLIVVFAGVLFPLWPPFMRQGVYYLSLLMIGFLGFLMFLGVLRLIIYLVLLLVIGKSGWLFPNLFADVGVIESFQPFWVWEEAIKKKKKD